MLGMILPEDLLRRLVGNRIGKRLAVGVDLRALHGDEQILEQHLRRIGGARGGCGGGCRRERDREQRRPKHPADEAAAGAGSLAIRPHLEPHTTNVDSGMLTRVATTHWISRW